MAPLPLAGIIAAAPALVEVVAKMFDKGTTAGLANVNDNLESISEKVEGLEGAARGVMEGIEPLGAEVPRLTASVARLTEEFGEFRLEVTELGNSLKHLNRIAAGILAVVTIIAVKVVFFSS